MLRSSTHWAAAWVMRRRDLAVARSEEVRSTPALIAAAI
jgi:hypothetical protein